MALSEECARLIRREHSQKKVETEEQNSKMLNEMVS